MNDIRYGFGTTVDLRYDQAVERTREALSAEGFGVLTEIDVAATMKKKLDEEFRPYIILGACNPPLAFQALSAETDIGVLLPCNVIVYQDEDAAKSRVVAMDPEAAMELTANDAVRSVAAEVKNRLRRVIEAVGKG